MSAPLEIEAVLKAGPGLRYKRLVWAKALGTALGVRPRWAYWGCG